MRFKFLTLALALAATTPSAAPLEWRGVSLASAEFAETELPGIYGKHYVYPTPASAAYFAAKGMNLMRLPFTWERLQPSLNSPFDATNSRPAEMIAPRAWLVLKVRIMKSGKVAFTASARGAKKRMHTESGCGQVSVGTPLTSTTSQPSTVQ